MKRILLLLAAALCLTVSDVYGQSKADSYNNEGIKLYQQENYSAAFKSFKKSAEAGNAYGMYWLAFMYRDGKGTAMNKDEALRLFKVSAQKECTYAYVPLGRMLEANNQEKEAFNWYQKSANIGDQWGQYYLALCYLDGKGTDFNDEEMIRLLKASDAQGNEYAHKLLSIIPHRKVPLVTFNGLLSEYSTPSLTLDFCAKADVGRITKATVYLNGEKVPQSRDIVIVDDDCDLRQRRDLMLREGQNKIRVEVINSAGKGVREQNVTYKPGSEPKKERKLALIIGNSDYHDPNKNLPNPVNDANDMATKLNGLGFDTILVTNADYKLMGNKIDDFGERAKNYDVALFYYAGHGMAREGVNYLIPTDARLKSEGDAKFQCENDGRVLAKMEESRCKTKIVILDACRNNPFARSWYRGGSSNNGLLPPNNYPEGTIIAYATAPGDEARDGEGRNSPYTKALLQMLEIQGLKLEEFFKEVLRIVRRNTKGKQRPWYTSSLEGDFYFKK